MYPVDESVEVAPLVELEGARAEAAELRQSIAPLVEALEPVAEICSELEAKGYFDGCWEEANVYPNDVELSVADLKRARRALSDFKAHTQPEESEAA